MRIRRLDEQVALLKAVDEALRDSDYWRTTGFFSSVQGDNYYDHWLCLTIKEWAAEPDGSQQWDGCRRLRALSKVGSGGLVWDLRRYPSLLFGQ